MMKCAEWSVAVVERGGGSQVRPRTYPNALAAENLRQDLDVPVQLVPRIRSASPAQPDKGVVATSRVDLRLSAANLRLLWPRREACPIFRG